MAWMDKFKQLVYKDQTKLMNSGIWENVTIKRCSDEVEAIFKCTVIDDYDEMLLENYRSFEVSGALGLYLDNFHCNILKEDWNNAFTLPPIAKQQYEIFGRIFEIRKVYELVGVFYEIDFSGMAT